MNAREGSNKAQAAALAAAVEPSVRHSHDDTRARSRSRDKSLETPPRNSSEPTRTSLRKPSSPEGGNLKRDGGATRRHASDSDGDVSDDTQYERYASDRDDSSPRRREDDEDDEDDGEAYDPASDDHPGPPCDLKLEYWMRSEECTERKRAHVAAIDERGGYWGMEDHIEETVFEPHGDVVLERNMFPYETPREISHWTLWSRSPMSERDIVRWTKAWLLEHLPDALRFNYDLNDNNSIDIPHYHVFIERPVSDADEDERGAGSAASEPGELVKDSSTIDSDEGFEKKKEKRGRDETDSDAAPAAKAARFDRVEP